MSQLDAHTESVRIGIRAGMMYLTQKPPSESTVADLIRTLPQAGVVLHTFPIEVLQQVSRERGEIRRLYAIKALEALMHHAGDSTLLSNETLRTLSEKAWIVASSMEEQESVGRLLDSVREKST
jgi:hypothetical protein